MRRQLCTGWAVLCSKAPTYYIYGTRHKKVRKSNNMRDVSTEDCAYYIALLASLQQLLNKHWKLHK